MLISYGFFVAYKHYNAIENRIFPQARSIKIIIA